MLPKNTSSVPQFDPPTAITAKISDLLKQINALYAEAEEEEARRNSSISNSSANSNAVPVLIMENLDLLRPKTASEMFDFFESIKDMDVSTTAYAKSIANLKTPEEKIAFKSRFDDRAREYLMCRSGAYVSTSKRPFPNLKTLWPPFKGEYKCDGIRESAVKYAALTSGKTEAEIEAMGHPFKCLRSTTQEQEANV